METLFPTSLTNLSIDGFPNLKNLSSKGFNPHLPSISGTLELSKASIHSRGGSASFTRATSHRDVSSAKREMPTRKRTLLAQNIPHPLHRDRYKMI
ncbi:hypothetical protein DVH24_041933 [Malus domestica]|uniref:Uncharacterized protein n=1 Tax=Malus domestica TaxID=3750 RepID=A0A498ISN7_MALDO|nr:hypothetical protein DVH24_041933 [Malus domestica]